MSDFKKERKKLEQAGFAGQTLEQALKLLEKTGASRMVTKFLVALVEKQGKTPGKRGVFPCFQVKTGESLQPNFFLGIIQMIKKERLAATGPKDSGGGRKEEIQNEYSYCDQWLWAYRPPGIPQSFSRSGV